MNVKTHDTLALTAITTDLPDYSVIRNEFFEHFPLFWKLGAVNYACLTRYTGFSGDNGQIVAIYLCGLAYGKLSAYSENYQGQEDIWNPIFAWTLVRMRFHTSGRSCGYLKVLKSRLRSHNAGNAPDNHNTSLLIASPTVQIVGLYYGRRMDKPENTIKSFSLV